MGRPQSRARCLRGKSGSIIFVGLRSPMRSSGVPRQGMALYTAASSRQGARSGISSLAGPSHPPCGSGRSLCGLAAGRHAFGALVRYLRPGADLRGVRRRDRLQLRSLPGLFTAVADHRIRDRNGVFLQLLFDSLGPLRGPSQHPAPLMWREAGVASLVP